MVANAGREQGACPDWCSQQHMATTDGTGGYHCQGTWTTVPLSLHDPVRVDRSRCLPNALSCQVIQASAGSTDVFALLQVASSGLVAALDTCDALDVAVWLPEVAYDFDERLPLDPELRPPAPFWQLEPCPAWCDVEHQDCDPVARRFHLTPGPSLTIEHRDRLVRDFGLPAETGLDICPEQHVEHAFPRITLEFSQDCETVQLTVHEARLFASRLKEVIQIASPNAVSGTELRELEKDWT